MNSDLIQELTACLDLSLKNFEQDTIPRPTEIKRLREALAAGKAFGEAPAVVREEISYTEKLRHRKMQEQAENKVGYLAKMKMKNENQKQINAAFSEAFEKQKAINDQRPVTEVTVTIVPSPAR